MRNKSLLLLVGVLSLLTSQINAQGPGCRGLIRAMPRALELALGRQAPRIFPPIQQLQTPRNHNGGASIFPTFTPNIQQEGYRQTRAGNFNLFQEIQGLFNTFFQPNPSPHTHTLRMGDDGGFRSPGSPFPPIEGGDGTFYFFHTHEEDDEEGEPIRVLREDPLIYQATNEEATAIEGLENSPLQESLERLLRLIQFSLGHYNAGDEAAPPTVGALFGEEINLLPLPPTLTLNEIVEDILSTWRSMTREDQRNIEPLIESLFNTLLTAFYQPAVALQSPSLARAQTFVRILEESAQANPHGQPDPLILAHLIFELEALVRAGAINLEQLQDILRSIENREEAAFLAFGEDLEAGVALDNTGSRRLTESAIYAFLEARANLLLLHLIDPIGIQVSVTHLQSHAHTRLEPMLLGMTDPHDPASIAVERIAKALLKSQYRFKALCLAFWDTRLAGASIKWTPWQQAPFIHSDLGKLLFLVDLYRAHQGLMPEPR